MKNEKLEKQASSEIAGKSMNKSEIAERAEDEKFASDFVDVFGGFPQDQAIAMLVRRQREIRAEVERAIAESQAWISVEEKLPEPLLAEFKGQFSDIVEMFDSANNYWHGFFDFKSRKWWISQGYEDDAEVRAVYTITHWMPLPDPPKGNENV